MRFKLIDLLIAIGFMAVAAVLTKPLVPIGHPGVSLTVEIVAGTIFYLIGSSLLYRRLLLSPLLLPRCPVCRDRNLHYVMLSRSWPTETIQCAMCQAQIESCLDRMRSSDSASDVPQFELLWPYSFGGRWRRIKGAIVDQHGHEGVRG